jgi:hypothetical protein
VDDCISAFRSVLLIHSRDCVRYTGEKAGEAESGVAFGNIQQAPIIDILRHITTVLNYYEFIPFIQQGVAAADPCERAPVLNEQYLDH